MSLSLQLQTVGLDVPRLVTVVAYQMGMRILLERWLVGWLVGFDKAVTTMPWRKGLGSEVGRSSV